MKKIFLGLIFVYCFSLQACASSNIYKKIEDWDNNKILIKNQSGRIIYEITEEMGLIYSSVLVADTKLYYIDNSFYLVEVNLENLQAEKKISNVGCFCISNDKHYITVGQIFKKNETFYTTCIPELYDLKSFHKIELEKTDYSFLMNEFGINTYIDFVEQENCFEISYNWETVEPLFLLKLDIKSKKINRIK